MKSPTSYLIKVFATGFMVMVLISLPLFWARQRCKRALVSKLAGEAEYVFIEPSGLVRPEIENDPNVVQHSRVCARIDTQRLGFGIINYFDLREPGGSHSKVYSLNLPQNSQCLYFDDKAGLIVSCDIYPQDIPGKSVWVKKMRYYIGPEGFSKTADKTLGRFIRPIMNEGWLRERTLYDKGLRRFFTIDFNKRIVIKGPQLAKDDPHKPFQIGNFGEHNLSWLDWEPPKKKATDEDAKKNVWLKPGSLMPIRGNYWFTCDGPSLLVLDESGRIDLVDRETLEFVGVAGYLPAAETFYTSKESVTPRDLLSYRIKTLAFKKSKEYRGMFVAGVSREGTSMSLAVYDANGRLVATGYTRSTVEERRRGRKGAARILKKEIPTCRAVFFNAPWAPFNTAIKYLLENLQPVIFSLASYFTASSFEAASGHRALFILPNSFVGMFGRDAGESIVGRFFFALVLILPSIILGLLLACWVGRDAVVVGFSKRTKLYWVIGTILFGLSAYIAYRLTKPKETLVTCINCGKLRRPDMERCHRCQSKWHVAELAAPLWRVIE